MKPTLPFFLLFFFASLGVFAQQHTISGSIADEFSGETLIAANIYVASVELGTASNNQGFYSLTLESGVYDIIFSYIGYQSDTINVDLTKNQRIDIVLKSSTTLSTIEVIDEKQNTINNSTQMSTVTIPMEQIKSLPRFLGEVDILRTLQLMPGIQSAGELQSGILVRGGSRDQNLIILDGVPVYNVSHILGIFSVFNADAIKNVNVIKGGFPARYGGRLSSVVEMNLKDGHKTEFHGSGSIGLITSKLMLEGPINDRSSFLVSARRTYIDVLAKPLIKARINPSDQEKIDPTFYFYDLNFKFNYKINDNNTIFLSWYNGKDVFRTKYSYESEHSKESRDIGPEWGNSIGALRLNTKLNAKTFINTRLIFSRYKMAFLGNASFENELQKETFNVSYISGIQDIGFHTSIDHAYSPRHYFRVGLNTTYHTYSPGINSLKFGVSGEEQISFTRGGRLYAWESSIYGEDEFNFGRLSGNVGLHVSYFRVEEENYFSLEPRLSFNYKLNTNASIKASYARMRQYINLLSSEALTLPSDFWVPSTATLKPQVSHQVAIGYAQQVKKKYEFSVEAYYKTMRNVVSYKEGVSFFSSGLNTSLNWEDKVTQGNGESYGLEFLFQKKFGRFTGWTSYTLSWNWREFDEINGGDRFPFRSDRRHDFSIVGNYKISDKIRLSASWIYQTGIAYSIPQGTYYDQRGVNSSFEPSRLGYYSSKNNFRLSPTHRLDMSIEFHKQKKHFERVWVISVYNVYNYVSPFYVGQVYDYKQEKNIYAEIGILPIIPSISYQFNF